MRLAFKPRQSVEPMQEGFLNLLPPRKGHFRLESGHHGDLWLDLGPLFLQPSKLRPFIEALAQRLSTYEVDAVCGPMAGGAFLAQAIAALLEIQFFYAERLASANRGESGGVTYRIPDDLRHRIPGRSVAIVDDVINAGSAVRATLTDVRACGGNPVAIGALLVLGSSALSFFARHDLTCEHVFSIPNNLWEPSKCPLCAAGTPLDDVRPDEQCRAQ